MNGFDGNAAVIDKVSRDRGAIGYVGGGGNLLQDTRVKVLAIRPAPGYSAFVPNGTSIRTMEYAMARELYLYTKADMSPLASDFIRFCKSDAGHAVADEAGFLGYQKKNLLAPPAFGDNAPADLVSAVKGCERIVISFRFRVGSPNLDTISSQNLILLSQMLNLPEYSQRRLIIVGCTDSRRTPERTKSFPGAGLRIRQYASAG